MVGQEFLKSTPIAVAWDGFESEVAGAQGDEEDVWESMDVRGEDGGSSEDDEESNDEELPPKTNKRMRK